MSKYDISDDHEWSDEKEPETDNITSVKSHVVTVIHDVEKEYQSADKYECHISHSDPNPPTVTHVVTFRNKGNYWRKLDMDDWRDFQDIPLTVRKRVADTVNESVSVLTPKDRIVNPDD